MHLTDPAEIMHWIIQLLESLVPSQEDIISVGRDLSRFDLEVIFEVSPEQEKIFTDEVCESIQILVASKTKIMSPVIYIRDKPHTKAFRSIENWRNSL